MKATGDETDSQIIIDYEKIQSDFSLYLSLDISHWEKWAFNGKPFPDEALANVSQEMQIFLKNNQGFMKGNLQLKSQLKMAQSYVKADLAKLTPSSGTETWKKAKSILLMEINRDENTNFIRNKTWSRRRNRKADC